MPPAVFCICALRKTFLREKQQRPAAFSLTAFQSAQSPWFWDLSISFLGADANFVKAAQTEVSWGHAGALSVLLGSGVGCLVCFCYKGFGLYFLSAALGTFKYSGECFKFLLMAAIELFLANVSIKVGHRQMKQFLPGLRAQRLLGGVTNPLLSAVMIWKQGCFAG